MEVRVIGRFELSGFYHYVKIYARELFNNENNFEFTYHCSEPTRTLINIQMQYVRDYTFCISNSFAYLFTCNRHRSVYPDISFHSLFVSVFLVPLAFLIHQSMVEIQSTIPTSKESNNSTLNFGNKLSVLGGDFLLAKASMELGKLENTEVVELISRALGHLSEGSIVVAWQSSDKPLTLREWEEHVFLLKGSLLANSCEAAVILLEHDRTVCHSVQGCIKATF